MAYKQRLLVVMPNGFGFNWPGHSPTSGYRVLAGISIGSGAAGLFDAAEAAVGKLAAAGSVKLPSSAIAPGPSAAPTTAAASAGQPPAPRRSADDVLGSVVLGLVVLAGVAFAVRWAARRRGWTRPGPSAVHLRLRLASIARLAIPGGAALLIVLVAGAAILVRSNAPARSQADAPAANP